MNYFRDVMSDEPVLHEHALYMRPPEPPVKDVAKRLPPTRMPSSNSQLVSIKESAKEAVDDNQSNSSTSSPPRLAGSDRSSRKKASISLFPDPARHQFSNPPQLRITIPSSQDKVEIKQPSSKGSTTASPDKDLTGLAKAKQRAIEARRRDNSSPLFGDSSSKATEKAAKHGLPTRNSAEEISSNASASPSSGSHRRTWSKRLRRRSRSLDSVASAAIVFPPSPPTSAARSPTPAPAMNISAPMPSVSQLKSPITESSQRLQAAVKSTSSSRHVRQSLSESSAGSHSPHTDDSSTAKKKNSIHGRSSSAGKLPLGVFPDQAARILPSSVKAALASHAQSESMGYPVLLPHEVVQLNDDHLALEKQIDQIKKELAAVRHQSSQLHEKMLDELRTCAAAPSTDSVSLNKLLQLQIDVATVEVRLDHTARRLAKAQHRRAEVRERLLMHLAGTHAMLECEKQSMAKGSTPPESPVQEGASRRVNMI